MRARPFGLEGRQSGRAATLLDQACIASFAMISLLYFRYAIAYAAHAPFWMDEVLALWTARQSNLAHVWLALKKGSEFTPPLYDSLLHLWIEAGASSPLMLRLPSIVAGYGAALTMGALVWRRFGWSLAALAAGVLLSGPLIDFAVQLRPYIFVTAVFGAALLVWDTLPAEGRLPGARLVGLWLLLTAMVALHFYAVLLVGMVGLAEIVRGAMRRQWPRLPVLIAVGAATLSLVCWLPIMQAASQFSRQDVFAPAYYGKPALARLWSDYRYLAGVPGFVATIPAGYIMLRHNGRFADGDAGVLALLLCAIPAVVFGFAVIVSHSYVFRYVIAGAYGIALGLVWIVSQSRTSRAHWSLAILLMLAMLRGAHGATDAGDKDQWTFAGLAQSAPGNDPIAVGDGLRFFELMANLPPQVARRIVFLDLRHVAARDPTNMHQVERWKTIDDRLRVVDAERFTATTAHFWLLTDPSSDADELPGWLAGRARLTPLPGKQPALIRVVIPGAIAPPQSASIVQNR